MRFMSQDAISRPTRVTARALMSFALLIAFIKYYGVDIPNQLNIYGVTLPSDQNYHIVVWIVAIFLVLGHLSNWYGDRVSYKGWNIKDKLTATAGFGSSVALMTKLDSVLKVVKEKVGQESEKQIMNAHLDEIKTDVIRLNSYAGWYIYGWNLIVPVTLCVGTLIWFTFG